MPHKFDHLSGVLLLRTGNDLSKSDVISSLDKYNYIDNNWWWNNPSDQQEFFVIEEEIFAFHIH